jgi:hypothetical protein
MKKALIAASVVLTSAAMWACGSSSPPELRRSGGNAVTAAEIFEQRVKALQARREQRPYNKQVDPRDPYELLEVKIEDWLGTPEGRFAHSIKIPNPVPQDSGYRPGMTQQEYFELLCKNEAGEFIFKTIDNVLGVYQLRARRIYTEAEWQHLYALEDPYGYWVGEWDEVGFELVGPNLYSFFELPAAGRRKYGIEHKVAKIWHASMFGETPNDAKVARYSGYDGRENISMQLQFDTKPRARYGFTWRGVKRPMDREMGIAGGELVVLDLHTNEVLGVRRGYNIWNGRWTGRMCPRYGYGGGQDKTTYFTAWFIAKVLRPPRWQEFFASREKTRRLVGDTKDKRY